MKNIIPTSDILIEGKHSPKGKVVSTSDVIAQSLIVQGLATAAPVAPTATSTAPAPTAAEIEAAAAVIEKAAAASAAETASASGKKAATK